MLLQHTCVCIYTFCCLPGELGPLLQSLRPHITHAISEFNSIIVICILHIASTRCWGDAGSSFPPGCLQIAPSFNVPSLSTVISISLWLFLPHCGCTVGTRSCFLLFLASPCVLLGAFWIKESGRICSERRQLLQRGGSAFVLPCLLFC